MATRAHARAARVEPQVEADAFGASELPLLVLSSHGVTTPDQARAAIVRAATAPARTAEPTPRLRLLRRSRVALAWAAGWGAAGVVSTVPVWAATEVGGWLLWGTLLAVVIAVPLGNGAPLSIADTAPRCASVAVKTACVS